MLHPPIPPPTIVDDEFTAAWVTFVFAAACAELAAVCAVLPLENAEFAVP